MAWCVPENGVQTEQMPNDRSISLVTNPMRSLK